MLGQDIGVAIGGHVEPRRSLSLWR
jgi:hypothetical protein